MSFSLRRASSPRARRPLVAALTVAGTALAATALAGPAHAATTQYKLTLSAIPNATFSAINNNGDIIGDAPRPDSSFGGPFILKAGGTPLLLNAPAGQAGNGFATAEGLNNGDLVVGEFDSGDFTALKWLAGSATPTDLSQLPTLAKSFFNTQATAVNDSGLIVGFGETPGSNGDLTKSFTIQGSTVKVLPLLPRGGSDADAIAVDPAGTTIVGNADTTTQDAMAVEWVNGAIKKLPALGSTFTSGALAVNAADQVVGSAVLNSDGNAHAVLWANGKATDLHFGTGGDAEATSINASGVIVGDDAGEGGQHAFISQNGTATDLNTLIPAGSGVTLNTAASINDHGVIVGIATTANGGTVGYELTPAS